MILKYELPPTTQHATYLDTDETRWLSVLDACYRFRLCYPLTTLIRPTQQCTPTVNRGVEQGIHMTLDNISTLDSISIVP
ncbi:hypothetical protein PILCRDRAFT_622182 [Piloderma croceum F 1598]|uniref:Uncharacterized protein n=1 Tax=Piloderma croceum (strain F 1598) TaxID=765440 RepID=A0A0C3FBP7_PILCF|nr:hypothetical protein PILCRDRAFT_622182 [Piloderma croceum F 1598]